MTISRSDDSENRIELSRSKIKEIKLKEADVEVLCYSSDYVQFQKKVTSPVVMSEVVYGTCHCLCLII